MADDELTVLRRREASDLLRRDSDAVMLRSCWDCNAAHDHLKSSDAVLICFACGRYLYKGIDITKYNQEGDDGERSTDGSRSS